MGLEAPQGSAVAARATASDSALKGATQGCARARWPPGRLCPAHQLGDISGATGNSQVFRVSSDYLAPHNSHPNSMA